MYVTLILDGYKHFKMPKNILVVPLSFKTPYDCVVIVTLVCTTPDSGVIYIWIHDGHVLYGIVNTYIMLKVRIMLTIVDTSRQF